MSDNDSVYEDPMYDILTQPIATHKWKNTTVSYYHEEARHAVANITTWSFNRNLNVAHKDAIKKALQKDIQSAHLMGTIQAVRDKKKQIRIINGQHRLKAIEDVIREDIDMKFSLKLMFEVYDIDVNDLEDITEDHKDIDALFKTANKSLNFDLKDDINVICRNIVVQSKKDKVLGQCIIDKKEGTVHKPKFVTKDYYEIFKEAYPSGGWGMDAEEIVKRIKEINVYISMLSNKQLFGSDIVSIQKQNQLSRARKLNFYLNIDSKYSPSVWIQWLKTGVPKTLPK